MTIEIERLTFDGPGRVLGVDVARPVDDSLRTAVVILHGGGLRVGSREAVHSRALALAELGFVAVAPEYRFLGEAPWPAPLDDALAAVEWTRAHADELRIEPDRVVVQGHSAGGYLALLVGAIAQPAAVACFYPPTGLYAQAPPTDPPAGLQPVPQAEDGTVPSHQMLGDDLDPDRVRAASPIHRLDANFPPTVIQHGTSDWLSRPFSSQLLYDRLIELGVTAELHLYAGETHEFDITPAMLDVSMREVARFVRRFVSEPDRLMAEGRSANPMFTR